MKRIIFPLFVCLMVNGCVNSLSGDTYSRDDARKQMQVRYARVESSRPVVIEGERNAAGSLGGAVIGGMAGNTMGGGAGRGLATAVGAIGGAVAGSAVQERATRAQAVELILRMDDGTSMSVVQEVENINQFYAGQRVRMTIGNGNTRVAPL
jgi:outer membrane lipoprotein SlyB